MPYLREFRCVPGRVAVYLLCVKTWMRREAWQSSTEVDVAGIMAYLDFVVENLLLVKRCTPYEFFGVSYYEVLESGQVQLMRCCRGYFLL